MRRLVSFLVVLALLAVPAAVLASHTFQDVPNDAFYHQSATVMKEKEVTAGCNADGTLYCPDAPVTRGQMAVFLDALGALSPGRTPVVNADRLDGRDSSEFALASHTHEGGGSAPHDHDSAYVNEGQANSITSAMVTDGAIGTADLGTNAVNSAKIADNTVTSADLADGGVGNADLGANSVNSDKIADNTVSGADLADSTVANIDLGPNAVTSDKIADGSILFRDWSSNDCREGSIPKLVERGWGCAEDQVGAIGSFWSLSGNAGTTPGTHFLGTTDGRALEIRAAGGVGINTNSPNEELDIAGDIEAHSVRYSSPRTHYFSIAGEGFHPSNNTMTVSTGGGTGGTSASGSGWFWAPIHLPHGAVITGFTAFFYDDSTSDMAMDLYRRPYSGSGYFPIATLSSSGISGLGSVQSATLSAPVDNVNSGYLVRARSDWWEDTKTRIIGAVVTYTVSEAP